MFQPQSHFSPFLGKGVHLWLERGKEAKPFVVRELTELDLGLVLALFKNAFVERLEISSRDLEIKNQNGARCFRHLRDHAAELQCRVKSLRLTPYNFRRPPANFDYALFDFVACHLRPQELRVDVYNEQQAPLATLFDHPSMRSTLKHVQFHMSFCSAICAIPALMNVDTVQTCIVDTYSDPTPWVIRFAKAFETSKRGAKVVQSVTVIHDRCDDDEDDLLTPSPAAFAPLGKPQRRAIPALPNVSERELSNAAPTKPTAEVFLIRNMELCKRLEISKWSVWQEYDTHADTWRTDVYHLEIIDI